jgi:hypothetical protein
MQSSGDLTPYPQSIDGIASPVFRKNPGFIGGGHTLGGAREFDIPNKFSSELIDLTIQIIE